jgi:lysophospholipase L1-like esterase
MSKPCRFAPLLIFFLLTQAAMSQLPDKKETIRFLALGDSYTIGESVDEKERWPVQLVKQLQEAGYSCESPQIIATTGWRTDDLQKAIEQSRLEKNFNLVSLLIGVNNQYQGKSSSNYSAEFEALLKTAIEYAEGKKDRVFVVSIPDYGFTPFGKENQSAITKAIDQFNSINKTITARYGIKYFDITGISRRGLAEPDLIAADGLHPSARMYSEWVSLIRKGL